MFDNPGAPPPSEGTHLEFGSPLDGFSTRPTLGHGPISASDIIISDWRWSQSNAGPWVLLDPENIDVLFELDDGAGSISASSILDTKLPADRLDYPRATRGLADDLLSICPTPGRPRQSSELGSTVSAESAWVTTTPDAGGDGDLLKSPSHIAEHDSPATPEGDELRATNASSWNPCSREWLVPKVSNHFTFYTMPT